MVGPFAFTEAVVAEVLMVNLICGPPAAGKTTWVEERRELGDLVVDVDRIWEAVGLLTAYRKPPTLKSTVMDVRNMLMRRAASPPEGWSSWVIATAAERLQRCSLASSLGADRVVVLATPERVCLDRVDRSEERRHCRELHRRLIADWWGRYEADAAPGEHVVRPDEAAA